MALIKCPECQRQISNKATACPHCGHPQGPALPDLAPAVRAEKRASDAPKSKGNVGRRFANFILLFIGLVVAAIAVSYISNYHRTPLSPCASDWHKCTDNADLMNNSSDAVIPAQVACKHEATERAKYGTPTFPSFPFISFSSYQDGDGYPKTGKILLGEHDAQFSNAFGAMVHSSVNCLYDLNQHKVLGVYNVTDPSLLK
jgi:hypothetical protein